MRKTKGQMIETIMGKFISQWLLRPRVSRGDYKWTHLHPPCSLAATLNNTHSYSDATHFCLVGLAPQRLH